MHMFSNHGNEMIDQYMNDKVAILNLLMAAHNCCDALHLVHIRLSPLQIGGIVIVTFDLRHDIWVGLVTVNQECMQIILIYKKTV